MGKKKRRKKPASKKYVWGAVILVGVVTVAALVQAFVPSDSTVFAYLIPSSYAVLTAALAFYFGKSKAENTTGGIIYESAKAKDFADEEVG